MEFKSTELNFDEKVQFFDDRKRFSCDEEERFTSDSDGETSEGMNAAVFSAAKEHDEKSDSRKESDEKTDSKTESSLKENKAKDEDEKETKKAGAMTAIANMFQAKKEISNGVSSDETSGDAMKDGNTGLVKVFTEAINPMHYAKLLGARILAAAALAALAFTAVAAVALIIVMLLFSMLQPSTEDGQEITAEVLNEQSEAV